MTGNKFRAGDIKYGMLHTVHQNAIFKYTILNKLGSVVRMVVDSILPDAQSGPNDHRKDAPPFSLKLVNIQKYFTSNYYD